jgi:steroid delta-isomerase-like uncharacterized protein
VSDVARTLVERYYARLWNAWDDEAVEELLAEDFTFRGSLGDTVTGHQGFRSYRDKVRAAFPDFHNEIVDFVSDDDRAAARLHYTGRHHGVLFGVAGTGKPIAYDGAGFFTIRDGRIASLWVLGDQAALRAQLG